MKITQLAFVAPVIAVLGGCMETTPPAQVSKDAFYNSFLEQTLGQFVQRTGLTPSDSFDTADGRAFKVVATGPTMLVPAAYGYPGYVATPTCTLILYTERLDNKGTVDSWRIKSILANGQC